jgi:hypothetical protein
MRVLRTGALYLMTLSSEHLDHRPVQVLQQHALLTALDLNKCVRAHPSGSMSWCMTGTQGTHLCLCDSHSQQKQTMSCLCPGH